MIILNIELSLSCYDKYSKHSFMIKVAFLLIIKLSLSIIFLMKLLSFDFSSSSKGGFKSVFLSLFRNDVVLCYIIVSRLPEILRLLEPDTLLPYKLSSIVLNNKGIALRSSNIKSCSLSVLLAIEAE